MPLQNDDESINPTRSPVHVVYGGADRFKADTPQKLGRIALGSLDSWAPDAAEFANVFRIEDTGLANSVYQKAVAKLSTEPVEDFRIDFEDGYGFRTDEEEDGHARSAACELAVAFHAGTITSFAGFRIKSLSPETKKRAERTLNLFLRTFLERTGGKLPERFVVTLPKVFGGDEVKRLGELLDENEGESGLPEGSIGVEIMIETPQSLIDRKGRFAPPRLVRAAQGRCTSAHFGAYDYTSLLGISANHQSIGHDACDFARQIMLTTLSPLGVRLSDSVTIELPVPPNERESLSAAEQKENRDVVHKAWRKHFENITRSMANGFYQSWDLHPNQLVARYAAVYFFFLVAHYAQAKRLRGFIEKATQANITGNTFDDAASAQSLVNFFRRAVDCGAITESEIERSTGLSFDEIRRASFLEIMQAAFL